MNLYILDDNNQAVEEPDVRKWAAWLSENHHRKRVGYTDIDGGIHVDTIFLAAPTPEGKLWETMIFGGPDAYNIYRWNSYQEALEGHEKVVAAQKARAQSNTSKSASEDTGTTPGAS